MSCEETQQALSLYVDDQLALPARAAADEHLQHCPVCRAQLAETRSVIRGLSQLSRPVPPPNLASSINDALMIEAAARLREPQLPLGYRIAIWLRPRLLPYTIGSFASVILFIGMLAALRTSMMTFRNWAEASRKSDEVVVYKIVTSGDGGYDLTRPLPADVFAATRAPYAIESPSLNPRGALAALTRSQRHAHEQDDDDMVVVTDVFSNGNASLAGVVQPPRDRRMLEEFQAALRQDAAFVPASYDRRPETMRVVFVVQKVAVREQEF
jgi:Putative zinc-finger